MVARSVRVALCLWLVSSTVFGEVCPRVFTDLAKRGSDAELFWQSMTPLKSGAGNSSPFKFGWDAEMWHIQDSLAIIEQHAPSLKKLTKYLDDNGPHYTLAQLGQMMGMSPSGVRNALREGVEKEDGEYTLADLELSSLWSWKHGAQDKSDYAQILWKYVNTSLKGQNLPVVAKLEVDSGNRSDFAVELVMKGALSKPAEFKKSIDWLFNTVEYPETHFHVSFPKKNIESDQMI